MKIAGLFWKRWFLGPGILLMYVSWRCLPRWRTPTTSGPGSAVLARVEINLHAIEQTQLRRQRRVDGVGRPKFDFHTDRREIYALVIASYHDVARSIFLVSAIY